MVLSYNMFFFSPTGWFLGISIRVFVDLAFLQLGEYYSQTL